MKNPNVAIIRGAFLNEWEMQNYLPLKDKFDLTAFANLNPLNDKVGVSIVKLPSPMDFPEFPYRMPVLNRLFIDAHWLFGLEERLKGFDVAHVAETYYAYTQQALTAKEKGWVKKVVSTCWEIIPHNNEGIRNRKLWKKRAFREVDHFVCPTELARKCLVKEGCNSEKISVVRMGIDITRFKKEKGGKKFNVLFIGRLENEKGIWELLRSFKQILKKNDNISLTMVGDGSEREKAEQFAKSNRLSQEIKFKGRISYSKVISEYNKADIFVLPSKATKTWQEQYGMVLVEAMAAGLPIIATKTGAIEEVVDDAGILVEPGNAKQLTKALENLINNREKKIELGTRAAKRAKKFFDSYKIAKQIEKIYLS